MSAQATKQKTVAAKPAKGSGEQRVRLRLKAYDHKVLDQSAKQILETVKRTGAEVAGPIPLPITRNLYSVLRSTFVHKKSQEQFAMRTHKRIMDIFNPGQKTIDALMNLSLPAGVDIEIKM